MVVIISPLEVWVDWIVPTGNSMIRKDLRHIGVIRNGLSSTMSLTIWFSLSTNKTSMGKRMKNVWIEIAGFKINAWPWLNSFLSRRPIALVNKLSAQTALSAKTVLLVWLIIFIDKTLGTVLKLILKRPS
jgi:hypothetical protein